MYLKGSYLQDKDVKLARRYLALHRKTSLALKITFDAFLGLDGI